MLERELTLADVAAAHAAALDAQIRVLRQRRAVLRAAAGRGSTSEEMKLMHKLATLSDDARRRIVEEFVDEIFEGIDAEGGVGAKMRAAAPDLPDDPTDEQVAAWIELAELVADEDFRRRAREMAQAGDRSADAAGPDAAAAQRAAQAVAERAGEAVAAGIDPGSADAQPVVDELAATFAAAHGREDGPDFRAWLADTLQTFTDRRVERYWELLGIINGWPSRPPAVPAWEWLVTALRAGTVL